MSAPAKTSEQAIRAVARKLLETEGLDSVSMQAVAKAVGVRPPSLYKHFASRADLLRSITEDALEQLRQAVETAVRPGSASGVNLERMAYAYRDFAKRNSAAYRLIFADQPPSGSADLPARVAAAMLIQILAEAIGRKRALLGARTLVAFLHGFILLETGGLFRFGGDINQAFKFGLKTILDALLKM